MWNHGACERLALLCETTLIIIDGRCSNAILMFLMVLYLATFLAISHAASQPWRRLSVVGSRHVLDQQGESDDLDDTPFWYSVCCFALPLVFVRKSVLVSFFVKCRFIYI